MRRSAMKAKRSARYGLACGVMLLLGNGPLMAAPPWQKLVVFRRIEADPGKSYALADSNGPWCILAKTFSGELAEKQAQELVLELRGRYKLPAYTHRMTFAFSGTVEGKGVDEFGEPKKMRYRRGSDVEEVGVMVGDFAAVDDPEAQKTLDRLKYLQPESLQLRENKQISSPLAGLRWMQQAILPEGDPRKELGPMKHAFLTTNPLLPREYFVPKGPDRLVKEMNKGVQYSLLDCPGRYTVKVATFTGQVIIDQRKIREIEEGKDIPSRLAEAADRAHRLTMALRKQGVEAYEFHDRYASLVTVGSFDSVGSPREDGKTEINPAIHQLLSKYAAPTTPPVGQPPGALCTRSLEGIPFDPQPVIVEVPQTLISSSYERGDLLGRR